MATVKFYDTSAQWNRRAGHTTNSPQIEAKRFAESMATEDRARAAGVSVEVQRAAEALLARMRT